MVVCCSLFSERDKCHSRLGQLDLQCYNSLRNGYRASTLKNIRSQALIYSRFCEFYGLDMFPADSWQLIRYARYVANMVTSAETVNNYISGVRKLHQLAGFPVPGTNDPNLSHMLRAIKFELAHPIKRAVPMTPDLLRDIYRQIDLGSLEDVVCYIALLLGFFMFLRKSNLVPDTKLNFNSEEQLIRKDVRIGPNMVVVQIRWTKTMQYRDKQLWLPLIPVKDKTICPVFWIKWLMSHIGGKPEDPVLALP